MTGPAVRGSGPASRRPPASQQPAAGARAGDGSAARLQYLAAVCELLWPPPATIILGRGPSGRLRARAQADGRDTHFLLLLGQRRPRLLVPASGAASAAAVRGYSEPGSAPARIGTRVLSVALRSGIGRAAARSRLRMHAPPGADTIDSYLRAALGRDVLLSLHLSPARANRKPVLQLLTPAGQQVGYAKIGTNPLTRALVEAERDALSQVGSAAPAGLTAPGVLHYGQWRKMNVLVLSPLPLGLPRRPVQAAQLAAAMRAVAGVGGLHREPLAAGGYRRRLDDRLAACDATAERDRLRQALGSLTARAGGVSLQLGSWHGDWTPWNMASTSQGLLVWDWERFTGGTPVGFDALHYGLQRDIVPGSREPRAAAAGCIAGAPQTLAAFGIDAPAARITAVLYLADLATRYLADRQAQAGAMFGAAGSWLIPAITDEIDRLS